LVVDTGGLALTFDSVLSKLAKIKVNKSAGPDSIIQGCYFIYLFVSGNRAHKHHKHEQKKTDRNTDMQIDRH